MQSPMAGGATVQSPMAMSSHAPGTPASLGSQTPRLGHGRTMTPQTSMSSSTAPYLTPAAFPAAPPPQPQPPPPGPKMGPPGPVMNSSHPSSSFSLLSTQMQPSTSHALAAQFPPGSALSRLHQYAEGLSAGPDRHTAEYWRSFVNEFYLPTGHMHLVLWNPTSREQKGFDVPASVVSRWLQTNYVSGVRSTQLHLENPREYVSGLSTFPMPPRSSRFVHSVPSANVTHLLETTRATMSMHFDNGWQVQMLGLVRVAFVPATKVAQSPSLLSTTVTRLETQLRIESFDFLVQSHTSLLPSHSVLRSEIEQPIPLHVVKAILAANGLSTSNPVLPSHSHKLTENGAPAKAATASDGSSSSSKNSSSGNGNGNGNGTSADRRDDGKREGDGGAKDRGSEADKGKKETSDKEKPNSGSASGEEGKGAGAFSVKVDRLSVPDSPVNEYGITLRAMRCLEITESVCQLRDLMDFSMRDRASQQLGPIDALKRLALQYKDLQSRQVAPLAGVNMNAFGQAGASTATAGAGPGIGAGQQQQGLSSRVNGDQPGSVGAEESKSGGGAGGVKRSPAPTAMSSPNKKAR